MNGARSIEFEIGLAWPVFLLGLTVSLVSALWPMMRGSKRVNRVLLVPGVVLTTAGPLLYMHGMGRALLWGGEH